MDIKSEIEKRNVHQELNTKIQESQNQPDAAIK